MTNFLVGENVWHIYIEECQKTKIRKLYYKVEQFFDLDNSSCVLTGLE